MVFSCVRVRARMRTFACVLRPRARGGKVVRKRSSAGRLGGGQDGALCDENGQLGPKEFEDVMRRQIRHLAQVRAALRAAPPPRLPSLGSRNGARDPGPRSGCEAPVARCGMLPSTISLSLPPFALSPSILSRFGMLPALSCSRGTLSCSRSRGAILLMYGL